MFNSTKLSKKLIVVSCIVFTVLNTQLLKLFDEFPGFNLKSYAGFLLLRAGHKRFCQVYLSIVRF